MAGWPPEWEQQRSASACQLCAEGRPEETPSRIRFFSAACSDGYLNLSGVQRGYATLIWRGGHVCEPTELSPAEANAFWSDTLLVGRAMVQVYQPVKMNYQLLGNR